MTESKPRVCDHSTTRKLAIPIMTDRFVFTANYV